MNMRSTKCKAVVEQGWINDRTIFWIFNQFIEIAEMAVTAPHPVASAVFIQHEHLTWAKPALKSRKTHNILRFIFPLSALNQTKNRSIDFYVHYIKSYFRMISIWKHWKLDPTIPSHWKDWMSGNYLQLWVAIAIKCIVYKKHANTSKVWYRLSYISKLTIN